MLGWPRDLHWLSMEPLEHVLTQPEQVCLYLLADQPVVSNQALEAVCSQRTQPVFLFPGQQEEHMMLCLCPICRFRQAGAQHPPLCLTPAQPPHAAANTAGLNHRGCASSSETILHVTSAVLHRKYAFTFKIVWALFSSNKHRKYLKYQSLFL